MNMSESDQLSDMEDFNSTKSVLTPKEVYDFDTNVSTQKPQKQKRVTFAEPMVLYPLTEEQEIKSSIQQTMRGTKLGQEQSAKTTRKNNSTSQLSPRLYNFDSDPVENVLDSKSLFSYELRPDEQRIEAIIRQVGDSIIDRCKSIAESKVGMDSIHDLYMDFVKENQKELNEQLSNVYEELWNVTKSRENYRDYCGKLVLVIHGLMEEILIPLLSFTNANKEEHLEDMLEKDRSKYDTAYELVRIMEDKLRKCEGVFVHEHYETIEDTEEKKGKLDEYLKVVDYLKAQTNSKLLFGLKKLVKTFEEEEQEGKEKRDMD